MDHEFCMYVIGGLVAAVLGLAAWGRNEAAKYSEAQDDRIKDQQRFNKQMEELHDEL